MPAVDQNIALIFLAAAENQAEVNRRGGPKKYTAQTVVEDFERDVAPLMQAISALPEKDGVRFTAGPRKSGVTDDLYHDVTMISVTPAGEDRHAFTLRATRTHDNSLYVSIGYGETIKGVSSYREERPESKDFAPTRERLAEWFANLAPDRISDLQEVLIPNTDPPSMALENAVRVDSPLRLKLGGR